MICQYFNGTATTVPFTIPCPDCCIILNDEDVRTRQAPDIFYLRVTDMLAVNNGADQPAGLHEPCAGIKLDGS
jgi:hypothetical protein